MTVLPNEWSDYKLISSNILANARCCVLKFFSSVHLQMYSMYECMYVNEIRTQLKFLHQNRNKHKIFAVEARTLNATDYSPLWHSLWDRLLVPAWLTGRGRHESRQFTKQLWCHIVVCAYIRTCKPHISGKEARR